MFSNLPIDIVHLIIEYNGSMKLRNGIYMNQLDVKSKKFNRLREIYIKKKEVFDEIIINYGIKNPFYIDIFIYTETKIKFGFILDYFYIQDGFWISCYKDISRTEEYILSKAFNLLKNVNLQYYFIDRFNYY